MIDRSANLQRFVDAAFIGFDHGVATPAARRSIAKIFSALERPAAAAPGPGARVTACCHLD